MGPYVLGPAIGSDPVWNAYLAQLEGVASEAGTVRLVVYHDDFANDDEFKRLLATEVPLATTVAHDNVYLPEGLEVRENPYHVFDVVEGGTLAELLEYTRTNHYRIPPAIALRIALDTLSGLDAVQKATQSAHRAVEPEFILLTATGVARVAGFGDAALRTVATAAGLSIEPRVEYLAPEQLDDNRADVRSDVYAVGELLWEMLAGRRRFEGGGVSAVLKGQANVARPSTVAPAVTDKLDQVVLKALAPKPEVRFGDAAAFSAALAACDSKIASRSEVSFYLGVALREPLLRHRARVQELRDLLSASGAASPGASLGPGGALHGGTASPARDAAPEPTALVPAPAVGQPPRAGDGSPREVTKPVVAMPIREPSRPGVAQSAREATKPSVAMPAKEATKPSVAMPAKEATKPSVAMPAKDATKPRVAMPVREATKPSISTPIREASRPGIALPPKEPTRPSVAMPVKEATTPSVALPVKEATAPGVAVRGRDHGATHVETAIPAFKDTLSSQLFGPMSAGVGVAPVAPLSAEPQTTAPLQTAPTAQTTSSAQTTVPAQTTAPAPPVMQPSPPPASDANLDKTPDVTPGDDLFAGLDEPPPSPPPPSPPTPPPTAPSLAVEPVSQLEAAPPPTPHVHVPPSGISGAMGAVAADEIPSFIKPAPSRRSVVMVGAAVVAVILIGGIAFFATRGGGSSSATRTPPATQSAAAARTAPQTGPSTTGSTPPLTQLGASSGNATTLAPEVSDAAVVAAIEPDAATTTAATGAQPGGLDPSGAGAAGGLRPTNTGGGSTLVSPLGVAQPPIDPVVAPDSPPPTPRPIRRRREYRPDRI